MCLRADGIDLAVLQGAQQLHLGVERQLADLVEEQRAPVGFEEFADAFLDGAGEGALLVAEQDALDQVLGDRAAIDGDEGLGICGRFRPGWRARSAPCRRRIRLRSAPGWWRWRPCWPSSSTRCHGIAAGDQVGEAERAAGGGLDAGQLAGQRLDLERVLDGDFEPLRARPA